MEAKSGLTPKRGATDGRIELSEVFPRSGSIPILLVGGTCINSPPPLPAPGLPSIHPPTNHNVGGLSSAGMVVRANSKEGARCHCPGCYANTWPLYSVAIQQIRENQDTLTWIIYGHAMLIITAGNTKSYYAVGFSIFTFCIILTLCNILSIL